MLTSSQQLTGKRLFLLCFIRQAKKKQEDRLVSPLNLQLACPATEKRRRTQSSCARFRIFGPRSRRCLMSLPITPTVTISLNTQLRGGDYYFIIRFGARTSPPPNPPPSTPTIQIVDGKINHYPKLL